MTKTAKEKAMGMFETRLEVFAFNGFGKIEFMEKISGWAEKVGIDREELERMVDEAIASPPRTI